MTELIKINPTEFGLTEETAQTITKDLAQILSERSVLSAQYAEIITLDIDDPKTAKQAAELRKLIKNNRTKGIENWHKVNKEFYLRGGQFVDAIKRKEVVENERMEDALEQIEKRQEILEKERIAKVQTLRVSLIAEYVENADKMDLGNMQDDVWEAFYAAKKKEFEDKKEAERLAYIEFEREEKEKELHNSRRELALPYYQFWSEFEKSLHFGKQSEGDFTAFINRIKAAKLDFDNEQARIKEENDRLRAEAEARQKLQDQRAKLLQPYMAFIRDYNSLISILTSESDFQKEFNEIKKSAEYHWEFERTEQIRKQKEADDLAEKARQAEIENKKLQKELQDKKDAEAAAEKQRLADEEKAHKEAEKLAKAPIKKKLSVWVDSFEINRTFIEDENQTAKEIIAKFEAFKNWAKTQVENI